MEIVGLYDQRPFMARDQIEVAQINEYARRLADDKYRVFTVKRVSKESYPSCQAEIPESFWNHTAPDALALNPLDDKAHGKERLPGKSHY
jgi:hypothetical protein